MSIRNRQALTLCRGGLFLEAARCRAGASRTARDVPVSTLWAHTDRPYSFMNCRPESCKHGIEYSRAFSIEDRSALAA